MDDVCEAGDWKADWKYCAGLSAEGKDDSWDSFIIVLSEFLCKKAFSLVAT